MENMSSTGNEVRRTANRKPPGIVAGIVGYAVPPRSPLLTFISFVATEASLFALWYHILAASILHLCG